MWRTFGLVWKKAKNKPLHASGWVQTEEETPPRTTLSSHLILGRRVAVTTARKRNETKRVYLLHLQILHNILQSMVSWKV